MNEVVTDVQGTIAALRIRKPTRIGIDGVDGAGKSHLALAVASALNTVVIELDRYIEKNQGGYVPFIDYPSVASKISDSPFLVIEGVCLLAVTERLGCRLDCLIYVKRMSGSGLWADERQCDFPFGVEEAIRESRRDTELILEFQAQQEGRSYTPDVTPDAANEPDLSEEIMRSINLMRLLTSSSAEHLTNKGAYIKLKARANDGMRS